MRVDREKWQIGPQRPSADHIILGGSTGTRAKVEKEKKYDERLGRIYVDF